MLLISTVFNDIVLNYKAHKGMLYFIEGILFSNDSGVGGQIRIYDEIIEDAPDVTTRAGFMACFSPSTDGSNLFVGNINHKTKYISILKNVVATVNVDIVIYGELIKASKTDLLIEWFRKGR